MKILYLSYFCHPELFEILCELGLDPSVARQKYDTCLIGQLLANSDIGADNLEVISYLPSNSKTPKISSGSYKNKKIQYVWCSRKNVFSMFKAMKQIKKQVKQWLDRTEGEERIILTYAANPILLLPCQGFRSRVRFVTICSEVPKYRNMTEGFAIVNAIKKKVFSYFNDRMDGYVFMTKHMNEVCNTNNRPWTVVEGMAELEAVSKSVEKVNEMIMYAGGLHYENGIDVLLEAFARLNKPDATLVLCGIGNAVETVEKYTKQYDNIKYFGCIPNDEVRKLEQKATLLVNPRINDHQLTRYSFPSKTFEYFSSGTASLITELDGIPEQFYEFCFTCSEVTVDNLYKSIKEALETPLIKRQAIADKAYDFLKNEKSPKAQSDKIVTLLMSVMRT